MILQVYIDDQTAAYLLHAEASLGRPMDELAEAAVAESALDYAKGAGILATSFPFGTPKSEPNLASPTTFQKHIIRDSSGVWRKP